MNDSPLAQKIFAQHDTFIENRPVGADEDVHMLPSIVDQLITAFSRPSDVVFDPFAGFGTTLERAVALGRKAVGIELLPERVAYIKRRVPEACIIEGDARELLSLFSAAGRAELANLVITSPPYMTENAHEADPLTAYEENTGDYQRYLSELGLVASQCAALLASGGHVIWNVADIFHEGHTTRLIRDCKRVLEQHFTHVQTTEIVWDKHPHDLVADALLVFRAAA